MRENEDYEAILPVSIPQAANYSLPDDSLLAFYNDLEERIYWIDEQINSYTLNLIHYIIKWNKEDRDIETDKRKPIRLLIHSPGGSLEVLSAISDIIRLSKTPIIGINLSNAYSAAAMILLSCHKRYGLQGSTVLFHKGSCSGIEGSYDEIASFMEDYKKQVAKLSAIIRERTSFTEEEISEKMKSDWYISAQDCVKYGVYDGIIQSIDKFL